jgi:hypothetical protein
MSIPYCELPSATTIKNLSQRSDDQWLFVQSSATLFATAATVLSILFMMPMVIAAPVGMIYGTTFWSGDLDAVQAWIRSALLCALTVSAVLVLASGLMRIFTRFQFGAPAFYGEMEVALSHEETRKLVRSYLRANSIDETFAVAKSERRQIALMSESRFSSTYLEVSTVALDDERTWVVFRGASKLDGGAILMNSFYTDFGRSRESALKLMKVFKPYASNKKGRSHVRSKQALPKVRLDETAPPPTVRKKQRYQHQCTEADLRHLKAC